MYNKLFTKILDSSIWLESHATIRVWITLLAQMDEDGFCPFASVRNLAHRARVTDEEATEAVRILEAPDPNSSNPANEGRRIERTQGGWYVINAAEHRDLATREQCKQRNRDRQRKHRALLSQHVTPLSQPVTHHNDSVTTSEAYTETETETETQSRASHEFTPEEAAISLCQDLLLTGKPIRLAAAEAITLRMQLHECSAQEAADEISEEWREYDRTTTSFKKSFTKWLGECNAKLEDKPKMAWRRQDGVVIG